MYTLQFDGLFQSLAHYGKSGVRAGFMGYGWLLLRDDELIARGHGVVARAKNATSSVAEYLALIEGLEAMFDLGITGELIEIIGDARSVIDQMQGLAAVNSASVRPLYRRAARLAQRYTNLIWTWTPRRHNRVADALTRRAMQQIHSDQRNFLAAVQAIDPRNQNGVAGARFLPLSDLRIYQAALLRG